MSIAIEVPVGSWSSKLGLGSHSVCKNFLDHPAVGAQAAQAVRTAVARTPDHWLAGRLQQHGVGG